MQRIDIETLAAFEDPFLLERRTGNFLNAANSEVIGDLSKEANLLENAGEFSRKYRCEFTLVCYYLEWHGEMETEVGAGHTNQEQTRPHNISHL
ncbi:hypothetical protein Tco_1206427 [Tanacetum coccineum]